MKRAALALVLPLLGFAGAVGATAVSLGAGGTPVERIYLGVLLGLAGVLPATAAVFALLNAMSCHPARSKLRQALLGAVTGSVAYCLCVLVGSVTLGPFLEEHHPLRPRLAEWLEPLAGYTSIEVLLFAVLFAPALPLALWSAWNAHAAPKDLGK